MCKQYGKKGVRAALASLLRLSPLHSVMAHFRVTIHRLDGGCHSSVLRWCSVCCWRGTGVYNGRGLPPVDAIGDCVWLCLQMVLDDASCQFQVA
jgi:hypothetical protein